MKRKKSQKIYGLVLRPTVLCISCLLLLLVIQVPLVESVPFTGIATLEPTTSYNKVSLPDFGTGDITSFLSGNFTYYVADRFGDNPVTDMTITGINMLGSPAIIAGLSTGDIYFSFDPSLPSSGTWNLDTGEINVIFPYKISFSDPDFVNFLTNLGDPSPFSGAMTKTGFYTGELPSEVGQTVEGGMSLDGYFSGHGSVSVEVHNHSDNTVENTSVPEPSTCLLCLFGLLGVIGVKKKFRFTL